MENEYKGNEGLIPEPPAFTNEELRRCREAGDFRPVLFEWYKFVSSLTALLAHIQSESQAFRTIPATHYHVLIGLLNRCARLMLSNVALSHEGKFGETTAIVDRCIFESAVKILWLLQDPVDGRFNRYLGDGLKTEIEFKDLIQSNIASRDGQALTIEIRMLRSIENHIAAAGMTEAAVISTTKLPDMASMIDSLGFDRLFYVVGQRIGSHHVHGTWPSLMVHYLEERDEGMPFRFAPRGRHCDTHINQYAFVPLVIIDAMKAYVGYVFNELGDTDAFVGLFDSTEEEIRKVYADAIADDP